MDGKHEALRRYLHLLAKGGKFSIDGKHEALRRCLHLLAPATGSASWPPDDTSIMILRLVLIEASSPLEVYYILHIGRSVKQFFQKTENFPLDQWENCVMKNMSLSSAVFSLRIRIRIRVSENSESECLRLSSRILLVVGIKLLA